MANSKNLELNGTVERGEGKEYTITDLTIILGKRRNTVWSFIDEGLLEARKEGAVWLVTEEQLQKFEEDYPEKLKRRIETKDVERAPGMTYSIAEVQKILGRSYVVVWDYITCGALKAEKEGGRWRITEEALTEFENTTDKPKHTKYTRSPVNYEKVKEYTKEKYDRAVVLLPKGMREEMKKRAYERGLSLNDVFIQSACKMLKMKVPKKDAPAYSVLYGLNKEDSEE